MTSALIQDTTKMEQVHGTETEVHQGRERGLQGSSTSFALHEEISAVLDTEHPLTSNNVKIPSVCMLRSLTLQVWQF